MKHTVPFIIRLMVICVLTAASVSCSKEAKDKTINTQEESISKYISSNFSDYRLVTREGSNRIIIDSGFGTDALEFGDSLTFYYAGYVFNNGPSQIFATNDQSVAEKNNFDITTQKDTYSAYSVLFESGSFVSGLVNGLYGVTEGEHCIILFSARYGFGDKAVANVPGLSALIYEVWVEGIKKNQ